MVEASFSVRSLRLQPHLDSGIENLVGVVWSSMASSGCEDLQIVKELHRQFILLLHLWNRCGLLNRFGDFPSATNNVRPALGGAAAAARRQRGLEVQDEGLRFLRISF
jgi:hypothetical protein